MIGKKIKEYRQLLKVTGTVLANLAGIKQSYLSQIENERKVPPLDTFINLVTAISKVAPLNNENAPYILTEENYKDFRKMLLVKDMAPLVDENNNVIGLEYSIKYNDIDIYDFYPVRFSENIEDVIRDFYFNDYKSSDSDVRNLIDSDYMHNGELEVPLYHIEEITQPLYEWWYNYILQDIMRSGVKDNIIYVDKEINEIDTPVSEFETNLSEGDRRLLSELWPLMNDDGTFTPNNDENKYSLNISKEILNGKNVRFDLSTIYLKETILSLDGELLTNKEEEMLDVALGAIRYFRNVK